MGVDTHLDVHLAAAIDHIGGLLGVQSFPTAPAGYRSLTGSSRAFGPVEVVGVGGSGSHGACLSRHLRRVDIAVVDRPNRQLRRRTGKTDPVDAIEAARASQSGRAFGQAKTRDGNVEAIRALVFARRSARSTKVKTVNQIRHLGFTASDDLRLRLNGLTRRGVIFTAAARRARPVGDPVRCATKSALRVLGRRAQTIEEELEQLDAMIPDLVVAELAAGCRPSLCRRRCRCGDRTSRR